MDDVTTAKLLCRQYLEALRISYAKAEPIHDRLLNHYHSMGPVDQEEYKDWEIGVTEQNLHLDQD